MIKSTWQTLLYIVIYMWKYDEKDHTPREKWSCRMTRAAYILLRFAEMVISSNSRLFNAAIFGGSTHQTTSARAFIDGKTYPEWARLLLLDLQWLQVRRLKICGGTVARRISHGSPLTTV